MSSPRAQTSKSASVKPAAKKPAAAKTAGKADAASEPSRSEKAAFLSAMMDGIKPGSKAAEMSASKKGPQAAKAAKAVKPEKSAKGSAKAEASTAAPKVEVLRRISGAPARPATPESERALALAKELEATLADGRLDALQPHAMQALMAALCKIYSAQDESGERYPVLSGRGAVTGTDVMIVCGALLRAVDLQVFELGMWQSWSGR